MQKMFMFKYITQHLQVLKLISLSQTQNETTNPQTKTLDRSQQQLSIFKLWIFSICTKAYHINKYPLLFFSNCLWVTVTVIQ